MNLDVGPSAWGVGLRIAFSHHPLCSRFRHDVYRWGSWHVCRGCALLGAGILLGVAAVFLPTSLPPLAIITAALGLGSLQAITYLRRFGPAFRATAKLAGGVGVMLLMVGLWRHGGLNALLWASVVLGPLAIAGQVLRVRSMGKTCDRCPFKRDWDRCPGFQPHEPYADAASLGDEAETIGWLRP